MPGCRLNQKTADAMQDAGQNCEAVNDHVAENWEDAADGGN